MTTAWQAAGEAVAAQWYGIVATGQCLPGEYDHNICLSVAGEPHAVLKLMHPDADAALVALQVDVLRHLAQAAPALAVPLALPPATAGKRTADEEEAAEGEGRSPHKHQKVGEDTAGEVAPAFEAEAAGDDDEWEWWRRRSAT